jgi:hypothetical protein
VELNDFRMPALFRWIEAGPKKGGGIFGMGIAAFHLGCVLVRELEHEISASSAHGVGEFSSMPSEVMEGSFGTILLPLKKHWCARAEEP